MNSRRFVPNLLRYMCGKSLSQCQKFWQSYCQNKIVQFLGHLLQATLADNRRTDARTG